MSSHEIMHKLGVLIGALMIGAGILVGVRLITRLPSTVAHSTSGSEVTVPAAETRSEPIALNLPSSPQSSNDMKPTGEPFPTLIVGLTEHMPSPLLVGLDLLGARSVRVAGPNMNADTDLVLSYGDHESATAQPVYSQVFAVVDRFDTPTPSIPWAQLQDAWEGNNRRYRKLAILANNAASLQHIFGTPAGTNVFTFDSIDAISTALLKGDADLALVPFDQLIPTLTVFDVDGQNPLVTDEQFQLAQYPLVATVYAHRDGSAVDEETLSAFLSALPETNRDPNRMTTVAMTGVTAMVRFTAARMDQRGSSWPAEIVGPGLAGADITAISNEVPFVDGCETDLDPDNVVFCSKPEYLEALLASGVDIVGLTGNHQNDHGPEDALRSLQYYADAGIQVYGGGANKTAAMQPLVIDHNGNRIAFIGANSYGPPEAWATDNLPGSAPFDLNIMSAMIRGLKSDDEADVVLAELQYQESYGVIPLPEQQQDFRALVRAGADVVTGVQSHVPQAIEFLDGNPILYGLGNLFFDQMWSDDTREGLIVNHIVYEGRHISTRLLPTILYDYGQPRWASSIDRARILERIFNALPLQ